jgi:hypothetical protein
MDLCLPRALSLGHPLLYPGCIGVHKLTAYRGGTQTQEVAVNYQIV